MRYDWDLVEPNEVTQEIGAIISDATEKVAKSHSAYCLTWYHDQPLWYIIGPKGAGDINRTLQIGIVRVAGEQKIEITPDWEHIEEGKVKTPEVIQVNDLTVLSVEGLSRKLMIDKLEEAWNTASFLKNGSEVVEIPLSKFLSTTQESL
jgi:hypothetical protein